MTSENKDKKPSGEMEHNRLVGKLDAYLLGESFNDYLILVKNYFDLNGVRDDKFKVRLLINQIGSAASTKILKAIKPTSLEELSYDSLLITCKSIFNIERNTIVEHFRFNMRHQNEGESLSDYAIELQALAEHCDFKDFYDTALRDRFVSGIRNKETKKVLLTLSGTKKFTEVVENAKREELVQCASGRMQISESGSVNRVNFDNNRYEGRKGRKRSASRGNDRYRDRSKSKEQATQNREDWKKNAECYRCHKRGHIAKNCRTKMGGNHNNAQNNRTSSNTNSLTDSLGHMEISDSEFMQKINQVLGESVNENKVQVVTLKLNTVKIPFEVDTGSRFSVMSNVDFLQYFPQGKLKKCEIPLSVVSGEKLSVRGKFWIKLTWKGKVSLLELIVIDSKRKFMPLLGREWLNVLCPSWRKAFLLNAISCKDKVMNESEKEFRNKMIREIESEYKELFDNDLSKPIKDIEVDIRMRKDVKGFIHKPYTVPHSLKERVETEIDNNEKSGIMRKVEYVEWASPMVTVRKPSGEIRSCLDGSKTINPYIETNHYPIPLIDDLLVNKSNAKWFSVLDLKGAYTQLRVNEKSQQFLGLNTIKGLYVYQRLPFGVKPAASIFQSAMDRILENLENVQAYIDDVLIWQETPEKLYKSMKKVLERLRQYNVKVNLEKCQWMVKEVKYLGHILTREGIKPNTDKIKAIIEAPEPQNVTQLKSFIGMVMYYSKFLKNLNVVLAPLYILLKKEQKWLWSEECVKAFKACKKELCEKHVLTHYDPKKQIMISCDASDDGISGVLSHLINGEEKPVFFVSRTLSLTEKKYPILHREALAIVFAMEKFYKYIYGHFVEIFTDHKPLLGIFGAKKGEPPVVASRLQRYVLRLSIFDYELKYRKGKENGNADGLSRLPINEMLSSEDENEEKICAIRSMLNDGKLSLNIEKIRKETESDELMRINE